MLLFDWKKIFEKSNGQPFAIFTIVKMLVQKQIPTNKFDRIYKYSGTDFRGLNFLVHADLLVFNAYKYTYREIAQYVAVASLRSLGEYHATGETSLDLLKIPVNLLYILEENRLLYMIDDRLYLLYEEATQETIH